MKDEKTGENVSTAMTELMYFGPYFGNKEKYLLSAIDEQHET